MSHKDRRKSTIKRVAIGGTIAAAAGYVAGVMTAPKSGKEIRKTIQQTTDKSYTEAEKDLKRLHTDLTKAITDTKKSSQKLTKTAQSELDDVLTKAKDTKEKARQLISAVHEGEANDKDLKKAIKDAGKAVDHLRDFLKK